MTDITIHLHLPESRSMFKKDNLSLRDDIVHLIEVAHRRLSHTAYSSQGESVRIEQHTIEKLCGIEEDETR